MEEDLISVIIPIYNVEKYLEKCSNSVISQTYKNLEMIWVEDGSPDDCGEICDNYKNKDNRIVVLHKKNGGLSDARNQGINIAKGKYITFIDSDDYVENNYIDYLYKLIKKYNTKVSVCSYYIEKEGKKKIDFGEKYYEEKLNTEQALERMLCEKGFSVSAWAKLYKKDLFEKINFPVGKLCEDNGTTYKIIEQCDYVAYGNEAKYYYIQRNNSIMNSNFNIKKLDLIELTDIMAEELIKKFPNIRNSIIKRKMHARFSILRQLVISNEKENKRLTIKLKKELIKGYWKQIFVNTSLEKRDIIAFFSLLLGINTYRFCWNFYLKIRKG